MFQSIAQRGSLPLGFSIQTSIGQVTQVRNHVKMYPWRQNRGNHDSYLETTKTPYTDRHNINEFRPSKKQRKPWMKVIPKDRDGQFNAFRWNEGYQSNPAGAKLTSAERLRRFQDSLRERGNARDRIAYDPPADVEDRILAIFRECQMEDTDASRSTNKDVDALNVDISQSKALKFNLINKCIEEFHHDLPSSHLNDVQYIRDLVEYYLTPVSGVNPYTSMLRREDSLPANLALIAEPLRFNKDSDSYFQGRTAFPGMVNKVPGIRGGKKYPVLNQDEFQWPDI